ncbi:hypothetical protein A3K33_00045 [Candidatus Azambacteria bacterium RIFOXYC1_FULL_41_20]|nr:MAG: hypothetical protein A3K33_00045 [Candidatus Azambacteria bacterium RIFOXYC1_FULL_41_20]OGD47225.1 MAG: hypothetical protein A3K35_00045 [Candidatus Azambacteria bacterium RIFOXYD1_FULL_42_38]
MRIVNSAIPLQLVSQVASRIVMILITELFSEMINLEWWQGLVSGIFVGLCFPSAWRITSRWIQELWDWFLEWLVS